MNSHCMQYVPALFATACFLAGCGGGEDAGQDEQVKSVPVVLTQAKSMPFEEVVSVQGNVEAKRCAAVSPRFSGIVERIFVDEGDRVEEGRTKLFEMDCLKLEKALKMSRQAQAMAKCGCAEKQANLERIEADLRKTELDYKRFKGLLGEGAATRDAFETKESIYLQTLASRKHAKVLTELAAEEERQAGEAVAMAEKDLSDAAVHAPLNGVVSNRFMEPGEMGSPGKPVVRIVDISQVEVSAFLPARYYARVTFGETAIRMKVRGAEPVDGRISYVSPTIDTVLRTFEVKCLLKQPPRGFVPGAMAEVSVVVEGHAGVGVPATSVERRAGKPVIFIASANRAHMVPVETGLETGGWIEVRSDAVREGTPVVSMGQFLLNDGSTVSVQEGGK